MSYKLHCDKCDAVTEEYPPRVRFNRIARCSPNGRVECEVSMCTYSTDGGTRLEFSLCKSCFHDLIQDILK